MFSTRMVNDPEAFAQATGGGDTTFDAAHYDKAYPDGIERHYWHRARNAILASALEREGLRGAPLLEIGCGRGLVTEALRAAGFDCRGVELAQAVPPVSVAPFVRTGTAFQGLPEAERVGVRGVLLLDVLEHVEEPVDFLAQIRAALPRCERLFVTVPARRELWSRWDEFYGHRCRYDRPSLRRELDAAGYSLRSCRYFFHGLYPFALAFKVLGAARSTEIVAPPESLMHRAAGRWFAAESAPLLGFLPGTSLLAVASCR
jgi:hypothetical protein